MVFLMVVLVTVRGINFSMDGEEFIFGFVLGLSLLFEFRVVLVFFLFS